MIEFKNVDVYNLNNAVRGLRNPMSSWSKSDSCLSDENTSIGEKDLNLLQRLVLAGTDHAKFLRQIFVSMDITAPLYWWKEMDQYRVGCTTNSESTMHKLLTTPIHSDCFSFDNDIKSDDQFWYVTEDYIKLIESLRLYALSRKSKDHWRGLIQLLPESWNQKRTWTADYQVLRNIYFARKNHKLIEWQTFCEKIETLPFAKSLITIQKEEENKNGAN